MKVKLKIEIPDSIIQACENNGVTRESIKERISHLLFLNLVERFLVDEEETIIEQFISEEEEEE
jgi:alkylhydroperoxidase/carboxymuconolactone decarboxylase family protein YurZ